MWEILIVLSIPSKVDWKIYKRQSFRRPNAFLGKYFLNTFLLQNTFLGKAYELNGHLVEDSGRDEMYTNDFDINDYDDGYDFGNANGESRGE